jgi:hypothetical protein
MRMLLGALALAASIVHSSARANAGQVDTLYTSPAHRTIAAFAQDGDLVSWFAPGASGCNEVWVWQLGGAQQRLPAQGAESHNVTCTWQVPAGSPVGLALAGNNGSPALLWTLHESAAQAVRFDYVLGAAVANPNERRFQEVAHTAKGAGLWLAGVSGSSSSLVYAVADVAYADQLACLSTPNAHGACRLKIDGGGVYRIVGRKPPLPVKGAPAAVAVAASGDNVAVVAAAGTSSTDGRPLASANVPVQVRDSLTGALVASVTPIGTPLAVGLSGEMLGLLGRAKGKLVLSWFDLSKGSLAGSVHVPAGAAPEISVADHTIVFHVGRSIRAVDTGTHRITTVAQAAAAPIGLSITGSRVAWAENVAGRGRIRDVLLQP